MSLLRIATLLLLATAFRAAMACDCFPPEARDKAAREALDGAKLAAYGRVLSVGTDGKVAILVTEAYKGTTKNTTLEASTDASQCAMRASFSVDEEVLLLTYEETITACNKYARDNFMVESFRRIVPK